MRAPSRPTWVPGTRNSRCASRRSSSRYRRSLPLLDHRLVEFSWRPPASLKLQGRTTKWLLRAILDRYVPRAGAGPSANEMWALAMLSAWAESTASNGSTAEVPVQSAAVCNEP
ncbi:MAG: asparagine synthase-related protein [Steroidobacteraceae bacterium]